MWWEPFLVTSDLQSCRCRQRRRDKYYNKISNTMFLSINVNSQRKQQIPQTIISSKTDTLWILCTVQLHFNDSASFLPTLSWQILTYKRLHHEYLKTNYTSTSQKNPMQLVCLKLTKIHQISIEMSKHRKFHMITNLLIWCVTTPDSFTTVQKSYVRIFTKTEDKTGTNWSYPCTD